MNLNNVLKTHNDVLVAIKNLESINLSAHPDPVKSWDTWKIINFIKTNGKKDSNILDVGCNSSPVLPYLHKLGFENLFGCDLDLESKRPIILLKILSLTGYRHYKPVIELFENKDGFYNLEQQNLENTNYESNFFDFVTALSVIEHGINIEKFFTEMNRIMQMNGHLLLSTDFWPEKIQTNSNAYNTTGFDNIFSRNEIENLIKSAEKTGFKIFEPVDFEHKDKVVYWKKTRKKFTFIFLCFKKTKNIN